MFKFPPPADPEKSPAPCARCRAQQVTPLYQTSRVRYLRCVTCGHIVVIVTPHEQREAIEAA